MSNLPNLNAAERELERFHASGPAVTHELLTTISDLRGEVERLKEHNEGHRKAQYKHLSECKELRDEIAGVQFELKEWQETAEKLTAERDAARFSLLDAKESLLKLNDAYIELSDENVRLREALRQAAKDLREAADDFGELEYPANENYYRTKAAAIDALLGETPNEQTS